MQTPTLGNLLVDLPPRDAVHVAIIAVTAGESIKPGAHVKFADPENRPGEVVPTQGKAIGVVDPFLHHSRVPKGGRCWMLLFPNTVTSLRHSWTHPDLPAETDHREPAPPTPQQSEAWLRAFVAAADCPDYDTMLAAATGEPLPNDHPEDYGPSRYRIDEDILIFLGSDAHGDIPPEFYDHVENVTGKKCPKRPTYLSCSC